MSMLVSFSVWALDTVDEAALENQLKTEGLGGWVHGVNTSESLFVFTWRSSKNFFVNEQFPAVGENEKINQSMKSWKRHDYVVIKGEFIKNKSPQKHILIKEIVKHEVWGGPGSDLTYEYDKTAMDEILKQTELVCKVHFVSPDGKILVIEYKDIILPVFNPNPELSLGLFREDKIKITYQLSALPPAPQHLMIDVKAKAPIEVLQKIADGHGKPIVIEGSLVMFPKSPQINFDVFALRQMDGDIQRNYTLVNFTDPDLFQKIRQKLADAWEKNKKFAEYDRNKFIIRKLVIRAEGTKNVIDPGQANPQVLLNSVDDVKVISEP